MSLLSEGDFAGLEEIVESAMMDTVVISGSSTRTRIDLPGGEWRYEAGPGSTIITIGMIGPLSTEAIERLRAGGIDYAGLEQIEVPKGVVVTGADTVQYTSARHGTTKQYKVEGVAPLGTYSVSNVLIVKAV